MELTSLAQETRLLLGSLTVHGQRNRNLSGGTDAGEPPAPYLFEAGL